MESRDGYSQYLKHDNKDLATIISLIINQDFAPVFAQESVMEIMEDSKSLKF